MSHVVSFNMNLQKTACITFIHKKKFKIDSWYPSPSLSPRYALVDFGLAQGTPDTQIELLKVVKSKSYRGGGSSGMVKDSLGRQKLVPLPPNNRNLAVHSITKAPVKRSCPPSRVKHTKVSALVYLFVYYILVMKVDTLMRSPRGV